MDRKLVNRNYTMAELAELYKLTKLNFDERPDDLKEIEDELFKELFEECKDRIFRYHTHESMLEHTEELELTEHEQNEAWRSLVEDTRTYSLPWYDQRRNHTRRSSNDTDTKHQSWAQIAAGEKYQPTVKDEVSEEKDSKAVVKAEVISEDIDFGNHNVAGSSSAVDSDVVGLTKMFGGIPLKQEDSIMSVGESLAVEIKSKNDFVFPSDLFLM
jgi:hypothetical protein